ncbi:hypothetical protein ACJJTC_016646 [Scirpophaga incertulas]
MGSNRLYSVLFVILSLYNIVKAASILALFSSLSFSDHLVFRAYVSLLTQKGHSVVLMTPYPGQFQYPDLENIVELDVGGESAQFWDEFKFLLTSTDDYFPRQRAIDELSLRIAIAQLRSKQMTALFINPHIKFDLVITEADVPLLYAVAEKYNAPHIAITTSSGKLHQHEAKGNPIHPVLYLDVNTLNTGRNISRWQKIIEYYRLIRTRNEYYYNYLPLCDLASKKIFGTQRDLLEIEYDIDMLFVASNPILDGNRPNVPAVIHVDRMHIKPTGQLPPNLKATLDSASNGAIYFSMGALQEPENLSPSILQTLLEAFSELPYTVLWRIANTTGINIPNNVVTKSWFPQQNVLGHPNVKLFITSGGQRSLEEAVFYQVPILGFPILRPRRNFIMQVTKFDAGELVDPYQLDKETLKSKITEIVTLEKYKKAMTKLKNMVFDPFISGPETAVWWTEYVLRHKGAKHFRSPAVGIGIVKYYLLDIICYVTIGSIIMLYSTFLMLKFIIKRLRVRFGKGESDSKYKVL